MEVVYLSSFFQKLRHIAKTIWLMYAWNLDDKQSTTWIILISIWLNCWCSLHSLVRNLVYFAGFNIPLQKLGCWKWQQQQLPAFRWQQWGHAFQLLTEISRQVLPLLLEILRKHHGPCLQAHVTYHLCNLCTGILCHLQ